MQRRSTYTDDLTLDRGGSLGGKGGNRRQDFAESLPWELSQSIFARLDPPSLCCAALTCRRWRSLIQGCDLLWRGGCLEIRAVCQREVDRDRGEGISWKVRSQVSGQRRDRCYRQHRIAPFYRTKPRSVNGTGLQQGSGQITF